MGKTKAMPDWLRDIVQRRDGGRCAFPDAHGGACGRTLDLHFERLPGWPGGYYDDPDAFRLVCRYHLRDGWGLKLVDWSRAARA